MIAAPSFDRAFQLYKSLRVRPGTPPDPKENDMKTLPYLVLSLVLLPGITAMAQNNKGNMNTTASSTAKPKPKRVQIFCATADQIKEAQAILKQRGFEDGEQTDKIDAETRAV